MSVKNDVLIVGGGLAGLCSAIHLSRSGYGVTLLEKNSYPVHKVCGEYISNEVLPYLRWLEADPETLKPSHIEELTVSTVKGKSITARLPLGGFGISRFALDHFLQQKAIKSGCNIIQDKVTSVTGTQVSTAANGILTGRIVLGAYGKRSTLDKKLSRNFIQQKSDWLAVKGHYRGVYPDNKVALYNFKGGYCGVSKVENGIINICYLTQYDLFKKYKDVETHRNEVLFKNPELKKIFGQCEPVFEKPLSISQISFARKETVNDHVMMTGDTAGLIHPFCGNGMAMAMHSAAIASSLIEQHFQGTIKTKEELEQRYSLAWKENFSKRIWAGKVLSGLLKKELLTDVMMGTLLKVPGLLSMLIKQTHGKPFFITA